MRDRMISEAEAPFWRVINPRSNNSLGNPVGYRLIPGETCPAFAQPGAAVLNSRRA